ncbi:MAG: hypothetical protein KME25_15780 [Symplocastrum torsivum CPER-KK1]|uniref:Uncharacterized protein n=1 Tax=Symplocastrum torsivum CPER-KK1 TaxID=450513 RepID=A0A951PLP9_9CYAN|nr:hypothetical protein [Symplocastrum torsivum CPER-KK1]
MSIKSLRQSRQPEVLKVALAERTGKGLTRYFLIASAAFFWFFCDSYRPIYAKAESIVVDMSVYGPVESGDFFRRAETMVSDEISRQFSQNLDLSEVEVVVVGDRYGEIVPILTTTVSRSQWQETPLVSVWTKYYNVSYALLQRHEGQPTQTVARTPARATISAQSSISEIDRAFDEGRLTGAAAQEYLDELD